MLITLIISAFFITGLHTLCLYEKAIYPDINGNYGMVSKMPLWFLSYYSKKWIGEYWSKPLFTCNVCMSSFWGIVLFCFDHHFSNKIFGFETIAYCIIFIIALTGINKIIYEKYLG